MNISEKNMLSLVRSALWGTPAGIQEPIEWSQIIEAASRQTLLGLVASAAGKLPQEQQPEEAAKTRLQRALFRIISSHNLLNIRLAEISEILNNNNIDHVLLKGEGLAQNYPDPTIRQCGDIDLYIGPNNCLKALRLLIAESGQEEEEVPLENAKHYHINDKGVVVELHKIADTVSGVCADRLYQQWTLEQLSGNNLRKVEIAGTTISLPPYNFDEIYILNHIWHHFIAGGIGLRQVCDWVLYLHKFHKEIDLRELESDLKSFGMWNIWQIFGELAVRHLGLPENELPLYTGTSHRKADALLEVILREGNFGYHAHVKSSPRPKGRIAGKLYTLNANAKRFFYIVSIAPYDVIRGWISFFINGILNFFRFNG